MKAFRFKLQPVLQLRQRRDDDAQRTLAQAERRLRDAEVALALAQAQLTAASEAATSATRDGASMTTLDWHRNWIAAKTRDVDATRLRVRDCQDVMNVRVREAQATRRDVRVLERFRDRARAGFDAEVARRELTAIDELAALRAARRLGDHQ